MMSTSFVDSDGVDQLCEWIEKQQALLILINSRINILVEVTYGCQKIKPNDFAHANRWFGGDPSTHGDEPVMFATYYYEPFKSLGV